MLFETLEDRRLMSVSPAPLQIKATASVEKIEVAVQLEKLKVKINGTLCADVKLSAVSHLVIDTVAGGDVILIGKCGLPVTIKAGVKVIANVAANVNANVLGIKADVLAKLNLSAGLKLNANANIDAAIGLLSKLKIDAGGALCSTIGVKVDVNACLGLLAHVGVQTGVSVDLGKCLDVCASVGIKPTVGLSILGLSINLKLSAQLNSCISQLAGIGLKLNLGGILKIG